MIAFKRLDLTRRQEVFDWFHRAGRLGCEYSFVNLYLWGRQHAAFVEGYLVVFSHFYGHSMYLFPSGHGPLKPVSPRRYGELRQGLLPPGGVRQEGVSLEFQASLARLYAGKDLLLTAARQEDGAIQALELLCRDPIAAAPRILKALRAEEGVFRVPYAKGRPFAMFLPLASWQGPPPAYFGLAFD